MAGNEKMKKLNIIFLVLSVFILWKCANQLPPGGGEVDRIPPEIIETNPPNGTTNFNDMSVEFNFSEYIDKNSIYDAIFISPAVEGGVEYDWSGKTLTMNFNDSLRKDITYIITVGTNLADLNNKNKMKSAFNLTFSTGNIIDKGQISGKVYSAKTTGVMVFAYLLDSNSVDPSTEKPNYVSQIGLDGKYSIAGLANGKYLVFAIKDEFKDLLYNVGEDEYGVPNKIITLSDKDSLVSNLDYFLTKDDTIKPNVVNITMTDRNHLMIELSEFTDSTKISAENFYIFDSTNSAKHSVKYLYKGKAGPKKYFISFNDSLISENENYLISNNIIDLYGNISDNGSNNFVVNTKPDTVAPSIVNVSTSFKKNESDYNDVNITFNFDDGFKIAGLDKLISLRDSKNNSVPYSLLKRDDASFSVISKIILRPKNNYSIKIDLNNIIDAAGNKLDSIYTYKFKTISDLYFSGVSGKIVKDSSKYPIVLKLNPIAKNSKKYSLNIKGSSNNFDFKRVLPGKYILWGFIDEDSSGTYNYGKMLPFEPSERFVFFPDTLNLRPRWPVGDIFIKFNTAK